MPACCESVGPSLNKALPKTPCGMRYIADDRWRSPYVLVIAPTSAMLPSDSTLSHFGFTLPDMINPFSMTVQDSNCTSIAWVTLRTCYSRLLLSALNENQQRAVIDANDGAIQAPSDNMQDSFGSLLNFGSNEYLYGSSGSPALILSPCPWASRARTSARSVRYNKVEVMN